MSKQRDGHFDLLRILACIAVLVIHITGTYTMAIFDNSVMGQYVTEYIPMILTYNVLSRFAVPCFIMLAGAYALSDTRNREYRYYYKRSMAKIGIPILVFSVIYTLFSAGILFAKIKFKGEGIEAFWAFLETIGLGMPFSHMWYLYMMIPLYLMVPVLIRWREGISQKAFQVTAVVIAIAGILSGWTSTYYLTWDIGRSFCYLGYFLLGYVIRERGIRAPGNFRGITLIVLGFLLEGIATVIQYRYTMRGIANNIMQPFSPLAAAAAILIFAGFSKVRIKKDLSRVASRTMLIYLLHSGIWYVAERVFRSYLMVDSRISIPVSIVSLFLVSYLAAVIYEHCWKWVDKKLRITERVCKLFRLQ